MADPFTGLRAGILRSGDVCDATSWRVVDARTSAGREKMEQLPLATDVTGGDDPIQIRFGTLAKSYNR